MNKGITIIILVAVLCAMGVVFFGHISQKKPAAPLVAANGGAGTGNGYAAQPAPPVNGQQGRQGNNDRLTNITPPLTNTDGRPSTIVLTPDGRVAPDTTRTPPPPGRGSQGIPLPSYTPKQEAPKKPEASTTPKTGEAPKAQSPGVPKAQEKPKSPETPKAQEPPKTSVPPKNSDAPPAAQNTATRPEAGSTSAATTPPAQAGQTPSRGSPGLTPWQGAPNDSSGGAQAVLPTGTTPTPESASQASLSDKAAHALKNIGLHFSGQNMRLRIEADSAFPCKTFVLTGPDRLVVDLPGSWRDMRGPNVPQNRIVKNIRVGKQDAGPRIVLDLAGPLTGHKVERNGNVVEILVQ